MHKFNMSQVFAYSGFGLAVLTLALLQEWAAMFVTIGGFTCGFVARDWVDKSPDS